MKLSFLFKVECLVKVVIFFFFKAECLASTYKNGGLSYKLPKNDIYIYIYIYWYKVEILL